MLNLSRIQLELEKAKEKLRTVEETIQKVEGKTFSNGPVRYGSIKVEVHPDKNRNPIIFDDNKNQRRRVIASAVDSRSQRLALDDASFNLKRNIRDKREGAGLKRLADGNPQGVFARLSGLSYQQQQDDEDEEEVVAKKPALSSQVVTTASEAPSRQEVIAAQVIDEQSKQRNRRMFGALVGTLQKFRKEETRVREREEKRLKVEKKLEEDAKREREKLMQEKRELFMEKKRREVEIKRIEWSLNRVKEYEAWEANVIPLKNFIQTQAKPHLFYMPSVHNAKTEERLQRSQKIIEKMIEKRKNNLKEEIENSEKKARSKAAEGIGEEEEAENIPEDNEAHNQEQEMVEGFEENDKKKNGFLLEGGRQMTENVMDSKEEKGTNIEETLHKHEEKVIEKGNDSEKENESKEKSMKDSENKVESPVSIRNLDESESRDATTEERSEPENTEKEQDGESHGEKENEEEMEEEKAFLTGGTIVQENGEEQNESIIAKEFAPNSTNEEK